MRAPTPTRALLPLATASLTSCLNASSVPHDTPDSEAWELNAALFNMRFAYVRAFR